MEKYLKVLFDLRKLPTKFFFLVSVVSGFILFVNERFLNERLFLDNLKEKHGWILGIIFILTSGLVFVNFVIWVFKSIQRRILINKWKKKFAKRIRTLDRFEKAILREFILNGQKSIDMPIDNSAVAGLLNNNILVMNRQFNNTSIMKGMIVSLSINEYVLEILKPRDIDWSDPPSEQQIKNANKNRPEWINKWY